MSILSPLVGIAPAIIGATSQRGQKSASGVARQRAPAIMPSLGGGLPTWVWVGGGIAVLGGLMLFVANRE